MRNVNTLKQDLKTFVEISRRIEVKRKYGIATSILNEVNYLYYSKQIGKKQYKRIYRKLFWKSVFSFKTSFRLFERTGILFTSPQAQLVYLGQVKANLSKKINNKTPLINLTEAQ